MGPWRSRPTRGGHKSRDHVSAQTVDSIAEQGSSIIKLCLHTDLRFARTVSSLGALRDPRPEASVRPGRKGDCGAILVPQSGTRSGCGMRDAGCGAYIVSIFGAEVGIIQKRRGVGALGLSGEHVMCTATHLSQFSKRGSG